MVKSTGACRAAGRLTVAGGTDADDAAFGGTISRAAKPIGSTRLVAFCSTHTSRYLANCVAARVAGIAGSPSLLLLLCAAERTT